ncbi:unnamed protein product (macronuclear) [Paramecium tetraurelia]|uniref:EGF-like domain-containing protein n=1 Tax=Paramecium tetraurelia TaxID=5888 RepID=A0CJ22_PARTE|nr:uncharacterized protein GSPATT00007924001 [Paramecium tetraurelia]CAK70789.1 unnamed protein product [Paramecium tetraurelia]|eukprot:XP_001438186.1 hypothetical protein (macronuclear) [Paramecium tetraurelia strain d4-2]
MQYLVLIFLISSLINAVVGGWMIFYNGIHEFKTFTCASIGCLYGFKNQTYTGPALYLNCLTNPLTALRLDSLQMNSLENYVSLAPTLSNAYKLIMFDVYYTSQWVDDVIDFEFNNQIFQIRHSTSDPLPQTEGFCDSIQYELRTYNFTLPYSSNAYQFPKFTIYNPSVSAMIRNVHLSFQNCYPGCTQCTGPDKNQCTACSPNLAVLNGVCRCPIRQSVMQAYGCVNKCYITGSKIKSQNRICLDFAPTTLIYSVLSVVNLETWYNWNIIYDPQHIDVVDKKLAPYNFGLFRFREGVYTSISTAYGIYPLGTIVQIVFCNATPINTGVQFYVNQTYVGSVYYDGTQYIFDKVELRSQSVYPVTGECTNNQFISVEIFTTFIEQKLTYSIQGNFTSPGAAWFLRLVQITTGYCPYACFKCDMFYRCIQCPSGYVKISDGTCQYWGCPIESTYNGTHCVKYNEATKYSQYFVREFYDFAATDTLNTTFILESSVPTDLQKGPFVFWSYTDTKRVFGGKFVWAQSRFSQIYTLSPHHSLTIYFQVIFGPNFPTSPTNYFSYEINNGTQIKLTKTSTLSVIEKVLTYNPTLTVAIQCYGVNVIDSYCGISNYYIVVHYCKPYCNRCTNELTCDEWMTFDPNIVKVEQSQCLDNQFVDESTSTCEDCPIECLTCFNEYECFTCKPNYKLILTTCVIGCQLNQFHDGTNCLDCHYSCKQCQSTTYCIHCESTSLRYLENGQCKCYDGYYDQNTIQMCQPCDKLCTKCYGPSNQNCQSCIVLDQLILNGSSCECNIGYYFDEFQLKCELCSHRCETCFGQSDSTCLSCHSTQFRVLDGFYCKCNDGYFDNIQDICVQCPVAEDALLGSCYKICGNGSSIWFNQICPTFVCPLGYNTVNNQCKPICGDLIIVAGEQCDDGNLIQFDGCHNCRYQCPAQCTVCDNTTVFPCLDMCGDGVVSGLEECDDSNSVQFDGCYQCKIECQPQCTRCNKGACSECQTFGWMFDPASNLCIEKCGDRYVVGNEPCDDGYNFDGNDSCLACKRVCRDDCKTCSDDGTTCLECKTIGFRPYTYYCVNICGDGYLAVDPYNRYIEQCDDFNLVNYDGCNAACLFQCQTIDICTSCVSNKCQSCISTYYLDASKNKCIELCYDNIIVGNEKCEDMNSLMLDGCYNCQLSCQQSCQTCTINGCTQCKAGYLLTNYQCVNICGDAIVVFGEDCDDGNLNPFDACHQCVYQCSPYCLTCHKGQCLQCQRDYIKIKGACWKYQDLLMQNEQNLQIIEETQIIFFEFCSHYDKMNCQKCQYPYTYNQFAQQCEIQLEYLTHYDGPTGQDYIQPLLEFCLIQYHETCLKCYNNFELDDYNNSCQPICGDNQLNGYEQCEDNNSLLFDGCYECKYSCDYSCEYCQFGKCFRCQQDQILVDEKYCQPKAVCNQIQGFYLDEETNTCIENCGDGIVSKNEECDDGNVIQYDGCYQCKYQCQPYCSECIKGKCIIRPSPCSVGFYFSFETLSCESMCGDGILVESQEECDDGNQSDEDECTNNCKLQCDSKCAQCEKQNKCLSCKENYLLINNKCEDIENLDNFIKNCEISIDNECLQCEQGFTLKNNNCITYCGDGIQNGKELCDDGNKINGDGCDINCTPSQDSYCRDSECTILISPSAQLVFSNEFFGLQYAELIYDQDMRLAEDYTKQDYLENLVFFIEGRNESANISYQTNSINQDLNYIIISIQIEFLEYIQDPVLKVRFNNNQILENEYGLSIKQQILSTKLLSPNVLDQSQQQSSQSLISMSSQLLKIMAVFIALSSITGQLQIITNLIDIIQQLYYLKYLNSRIGINLAQFYQTFKIIQLNNIYDQLNMNPDSNFKGVLTYYHSEPIFELDERNANFLNNISQLSLVYIILTVTLMILKFGTVLVIRKLSQLNAIHLKQSQLYIVNFIQKKCIKIRKIKYWPQIQSLFIAMIYEFGINIFLAMKYSQSDSEGYCGVMIAISTLLVSTLLLLSKLKQSNGLIKRLKLLNKEDNVYIYMCVQKLLFVMFLVFFFQSGAIQILLCILNEFQYCYFLYSYKIIKQPSENLKQLSSHIVQFIICSLYLINNFYQNDPQVLIMIGWSIISLMSTVLVITVITDFFDLIYPFFKKILQRQSVQNNELSEMFCVVENQVNVLNRQQF